VRAASTDSFITSPSEPVRDVALARHGGGLDGQQIAAHLGPGQAHHLAHLVLLLGTAKLYLRTPRKSFRFSAVTTTLASSSSCRP
jgi:hypothetical protein